MSLYADVETIQTAIDSMLYGDEPIDVTALDNLLNAKTETIERGVETLCKIRARKEADIAALKAEATRMREKAETEERALVRLEQYIMDMYKRSGQQKLTAGTFTVGKRTSTAVWVSPDFNNPEFMRTTTTCAPDKVAIKTALKTGIKIAGAHLVEKENLQIS